MQSVHWYHLFHIGMWAFDFRSKSFSRSWSLFLSRTGSLAFCELVMFIVNFPMHRVHDPFLIRSPEFMSLVLEVYCCDLTQVFRPFCLFRFCFGCFLRLAFMCTMVLQTQFSLLRRCCLHFAVLSHLYILQLPLIIICKTQRVNNKPITRIKESRQEHLPS